MARSFRTVIAAAAIVGGLGSSALAGNDQSVARQWNEAMLFAIRHDYARPTVHARNLFHTSVVMWDAWAAYDGHADTYLVHERHEADDIQAARAEAISYASYRLLSHRFANSPGADEALPVFDALMDSLGYDKDYMGTVGDDPASFGNRCATNMIQFGFLDGANEVNDYENQFYEPVNEPLIPDFPGNPDLTQPNRWQPLALEYFVDQSGNPIPKGYPEFLGPEWGIVDAFALSPDDLTINHRDGFDYWVYHDPGPPPHLDGEGDAYYRWGVTQVAIWSSHLDATDGVMIDISPGAIGNAPLPDADQYEKYYDLFNGGDWGTGYDVNPVTKEAYASQLVPRGDYGRILAEFWADGPDSETPPGHWFVIVNYVSDHELTVKQIGGEGPILDDLEWDVKMYLTMGGAMHDVAVASWGVKGWYDYIRPISAIRYLSDQGQSSDPKGPSYDPMGISLHEGLIEVITEETIAPGGRHNHLAGDGNENLGKIALFSWRGHEYIDDPDTDVAGVGWILAGNWWPYQRPTFVTPPFAGYVSGHSTYSRAAALVMSEMTGSEYFPGGLGEFVCPQNEFLVFEDGPSMDVTLQWASYMDASDQCSLSRIWGGIHPGADDIPGRQMGQIMGPEAVDLAKRYFAGVAVCPGDINDDGAASWSDLLMMLTNWGDCSGECRADLDLDGQVGPLDLMIMIGDWGACD